MGPEPITIAVLTSSRLGIAPPPCRGLRPLDLHDEVPEDVLVVPGPRPGLRMVLDGEDRQLAVGHALDRAIVQVDMGHLELRREGIRIDREAVVLRGDVDAAGAQVLDGLVAAAVAELQLERLSSEGEREQLVAEADPQERHVTGEFARGSHRCRDDIRIVRARVSAPSNAGVSCCWRNAARSMALRGWLGVAQASLTTNPDGWIVSDSMLSRFTP